jgi:hypothetical protein
MNFLKVLLIILLVIAGLLLVIPAFLPGEATVSAQTEIALSQELVFHQTARYADRAEWDPWLSMEPDAKVTIRSQPRYVGSTYAWEGDQIGTGKMRVDSVHYPDYMGWQYPDNLAVHFGRILSLWKVHTADDEGTASNLLYIRTGRLQGIP